MSIERLKPSHFFDEDRLAALRSIAPEAFADGKINWATLKDALGGELEEDDADAEHFGLFWPGKREARKMAGKPSAGTLVPAKGEGVDEEKTGNIYPRGFARLNHAWLTLSAISPSSSGVSFIPVLTHCSMTATEPLMRKANR